MKNIYFHLCTRSKPNKNDWICCKSIHEKRTVFHKQLNQLLQIIKNGLANNIDYALFKLVEDERGFKKKYPHNKVEIFWDCFI